MRELVLDTETTGLDPKSGHRLVEIACLELENRVATGQIYQAYINPERAMPEEAFRIHGLSDEFLADKPRFEEIVGDLLEFLGDTPLVIHNAEFDLRFINAELVLAGRSALSSSHPVVDTLMLARRRFPGAQVNLDALCRRFEIDNSARTYHGALLDCELLAEVYLELSGGRQPGFDLGKSERSKAQSATRAPRAERPPRPHAAGEAERAAHREMLKQIKSPVWDL